jgi:hypothetical protein
MSRVQPQPDGCWLWTGGKFANGYGMIQLQGKLRRVHRVIYVWTRGELPEDLQIDHTCKVKLCVNPMHMEAVTLAENVRRSNGWGGRESRKTHCVNGHPFSGDNLVTRPYGDGKRGRRCLTCHRETVRRAAAKKAAITM